MEVGERGLGRGNLIFLIFTCFHSIFCLIFLRIKEEEIKMETKTKPKEDSLTSLNGKFIMYRVVIADHQNQQYISFIETFGS